MRPFPSTAYRTAAMNRTVEVVPLLEITLVDGTTGYMSDRRISVTTESGPRVYVRRIKKWTGIQWSDDGSIASPTFTLSNIDRVLSAAASSHDFTRAQVVFKLYQPSVYAAGNTFEESAWTVWGGYCETTKGGKQTFDLNCKDGVYSLTLPFPRRRFMTNCPFTFDDGCECPYSGYGLQQVRNSDGTLQQGVLVQIANNASVVGPFGETFTPSSLPMANGGASDFDRAPNPILDGYSVPISLPPSLTYDFGGSIVGTMTLISIFLDPAILPILLMADLFALYDLFVTAFSGNPYDVPMSNAANAVEAIMQSNLDLWNSLPSGDHTANAQAIFLSNYDTLWNQYVSACAVIAGPNPVGRPEAALLSSIEDRLASGVTITVVGQTLTGNGRYPWATYYRDPISSTTPQPGIFAADGGRPGYVDCDKTFNSCYLRGMQRFFGGLRWIAAWATGVASRSLIGSLTGTNYDYATISTPNDTIYNTAVPMLYCRWADMPDSPLTGTRPLNGFITTPVQFQWRFEKTYTSVEGFVSLGRIGIASDSTSGTASDPQPPLSQFGGDVAGAIGGGYGSGILDIYVNGLIPTNGQYPLLGSGTWGYNPTKAVGMGVQRATGRIGERMVWDQIGGNLAEAAYWTNPITGKYEAQPEVFLSRMAGIFARVFDTNSGMNNPQVYNELSSIGSSNAGKYAGNSEPNIRCRIGDGRYGWQYSDPATRTYGPSSNNAWVFLDVYLEALALKYTTLATHALFVDLQTFVDWAAYCAQTVPNIVNPVGYTSNRYLWSGAFTDLQSALDALDSVLKDSYAIRVWRGLQIAVKPCTAGNFASDNTPRPAFQEFVNIIEDGSFEVDTPQIRFNEITFNFADVDFDFQKNSACIYSEAHQDWLGQQVNSKLELTRSENLSGTPTTDVATRLGKRWVCDEIGGVTPAQWKIQRVVTLNTTLMMAELEVADLTYIAHTLVPAGGQWVRIKSIQLNDDLSWQFVMRTFYVGNYDDTVIGVSSGTLAQFGYNPYIPGSGGQAYAALPCVQWTDEVTPEIEASIEVIPLTGIKLHWTPYIDQYPATLLNQDDALSYDQLTLGFQVFRTPGMQLSAPLAPTDTTAYVWDTSTMANVVLPQTMRINDPTPGSTDWEIVQVTAIDFLKNAVTIIRELESTTAVAHDVYEDLYVRLFAGGWLAETITHDATDIMIDTESADIIVGQTYMIENEMILVTAVENDTGPPPLNPVLTFLTVTRGYNGTVPQPHHQFRQLVNTYYQATVLDTSTSKYNGDLVFDYTDPYALATTSTTSTTTTTTTTTSTCTTTSTT